MAKVSRIGRAKAPVGETKEEKFKRIAAFRISKVLTGLKQLTDMTTNKTSYEYDETHLGKMVASMQTALNECGESFEKAIKRRREVKDKGHSEIGRQQIFTW